MANVTNEQWESYLRETLGRELWQLVTQPGKEAELLEALRRKYKPADVGTSEAKRNVWKCAGHALRYVGRLHQGIAVVRDVRFAFIGSSLSCQISMCTSVKQHSVAV